MSEFNVEKLNDVPTIRGFITAAVALFDEEIDRLINAIFRKTDFVVKSVVDSLFETSGPLFDLNIRLKVLLGLGVFDQHVFADINQFIALKERLNNDENEYAFTDEIIVDFAHELHFLDDKSLLNFPPTTGKEDSLLFQIKQQRKEKLLRSSLILAVIAIGEQLQAGNAL